MAGNTIGSGGSGGPTQAQLVANLDNEGAAEVNRKKLQDQVDLGAAGTDQDLAKAAQLANRASTQPGEPAQLMLPGMEDAAPASGPAATQATNSSGPANSLSARLQQEVAAQNAAHQAFQTAASSANVGNLISPRAAAVAAIAQPPASAGGTDSSAGPGLPPGVTAGPGGPQQPPGTQPGQPGGPMGSPLGGGQYGTAGNTFTDVATRQKAIQDDLNQAQTIYTQMAADRYKWQSTMQRIWSDMYTSILENLMTMVKNRMASFEKNQAGLMSVISGQ